VQFSLARKLIFTIIPSAREGTAGTVQDYADKPLSGV